MSAVTTRPYRLPALDGLRAVAALTVVGYHVGLACGYSVSGALAPLVAELKAGVGVFFVISGCVLYLPWARAFRSGTQPPSLRKYAQRRAARIVPAFWVVLLVYGLSPLNTTGLDASWWRYFGFAQVYTAHTIFGGVNVSWSLDVEVAFYAALPAFGMLLLRGSGRRNARRVRPRTQLGALAGIAGLGAAIRVVVAGSPTAAISGSGFALCTTLAGFLTWFAAGMALAVAVAEWQAGIPAAGALLRLGARPHRCWGLAGACFLAGAYLAPGDLFLSLYGLREHILILVGAVLLVLPALVPTDDASRRPIRRALEHPWATWLGTVSYGIYLWHVVVLGAIRGPGAEVSDTPVPLPSAVELLALVLAGSILAGAASWYLVERPAQGLLRRRRVHAVPVQVPVALADVG